MLRIATMLIAVAVVSQADVARADHRGFSYPKVRTFSGGYYGPTQAHWEYQRRYGQPWHGHGGLSVGTLPGYSRGYTSYRSWGGPFLAPWSHCGWGTSFTSVYGFGYYGTPIASPIITLPLLVDPPPVTVVPLTPVPLLPTPAPLFTPAPLTNGYQWPPPSGVVGPSGMPDLILPQALPLDAGLADRMDVEPLGPATVLPAESSPEAQLRSLRHQQHGDARLQNLDYLQASLRYQDAIAAAPERAAPYVGLGLAQTGMKRFEKAVLSLKQATALDPSWINAASLTDRLGHDNLIGKTQLKQRVADWALEDAHDADRLYLLGLLLHLDGDRDRARILLNTALALVGNEQHLLAVIADPVSPVGHQVPSPPPQRSLQPARPVTPTTELSVPPAGGTPPPPATVPEARNPPDELPAPLGPRFPDALP